ncbi:MFS transporter [Sphaerisporangium sp. TRM90804]|uniref:MFS transporter n=1 Tax=Sphaerisporangium sp. TRM90804 TaxID=3031113 RepID=UPI00244AAC45|nr:MFS transporter [Sphaerisporangium sp. TRM90804]MDH2427312.1 MFS transporter [Sphaerisporangium sp. TRM90804]
MAFDQGAGAATGERPGRWWILALAGVAQLMVVLDSTVVNIALPSVQADLGMSDAARGWVVTAYALAFGGLLLIGGRLSDRFGQKRAFVIGLLGFAVASGLAGLAPSAELLFAGRAAQGAFAAVLAPAALSIISTTFTASRERGIAFGVFGALTGVGAAVGLLVGGLLTEYLAWNWCLLINVPIAALTLARAVTVIPAAARGRAEPLDLPGMALSLLGMLAVVFSFSEMATHGWADPVVLALLAAGLLLLAGFAFWEGRTRHPLLPLRVVRDRVRAAAFLAIGLPQVSMFGFFLFLTYYFQLVLDYSPLQTGLAFLPLSLAIGVGSTVITATLAPRVAPRTLIVPALLSMAAGMLIMIGLDTGGPGVYLTRLLPAELLIGLGLGCVVAPAISMATGGVRPGDAGVASATVNVVQQVGGSVGTALLNTVATTAAGAYLAAGGAGGADAYTRAAVHGFTVALTVAFAVILATALVVWLMLKTRRPPAAPVPVPDVQEEGVS